MSTSPPIRNRSDYSADAPSAIALIPARAGSKRVPGKNTRELCGHPLLAYTISAAATSGVFEAVVVSTEDERTADIAQHYGAETPFLRPREFSGDRSPDFDWVQHALTALRAGGRTFDCFSILRPSNPFRTTSTIQRAWSQFVQETGVDSLRAVEKVRQHPAKMWIVHGNRMHPLLQDGPMNPPWHSSPYDVLPEIYVQNASLEIAWTRVVDAGTIAGDILMPFFTEGHEGFDINYEIDWERAERLIASGAAALPLVAFSRFASERGANSSVAVAK
jgi:CMP-N,N'-diacetyllegionaminic acid synthase